MYQYEKGKGLILKWTVKERIFTKINMQGKC